MREYLISYSTARELRAIADGELEHGAIDRLEEFGTADDVRVAAQMYRRVGDAERAAEMMQLLDEEEEK